MNQYNKSISKYIVRKLSKRTGFKYLPFNELCIKNEISKRLNKYHEIFECYVIK